VRARERCGVWFSSGGLSITHGLALERRRGTLSGGGSRGYGHGLMRSMDWSRFPGERGEWRDGAHSQAAPSRHDLPALSVLGWYPNHIGQTRLTWEGGAGWGGW